MTTPFFIAPYARPVRRNTAKALGNNPTKVRGELSQASGRMRKFHTQMKRFFEDRGMAPTHADGEAITKSFLKAFTNAGSPNAKGEVLDHFRLAHPMYGKVVDQVKQYDADFNHVNALQATLEAGQTAGVSAAD